MKNLYKKHKLLFHLIAVLLLQIILLSLQIQTSKNISIFSTAVSTVVTPIQSGSDFTFRKIADTWNNYVTFRNYKDMYWKAKKRIYELEKQMVLNDRLTKRIEELEALLKFHKTYNFKNEPAILTGVGPSSQFKTIYVNKGSSSGIKRFSPVINNLGLVGIVILTTPITSQVQLATDANSSISVVTGLGHVRGVLKGSGNDLMKIEFVDKLEHVRVGEKVYTSGMDHIYPPDILVGTVVNVSLDDELFLSITVKPTVDFAHLDSVLILIRESVVPEDLKLLEGLE
ncbi:MAG: rod shape-determining protein MreC [Acidobacteria bacterium]|nr:rod shape-determining protein MreC [Acidobacteriota bacterium]